MKTVLRQEWQASKKRIGITSIVLAGIMLFAISLNVLAYYTKDLHVSGFGTFLYIICLQLSTFGIALFALIKGSGNLHTVLFKDTNYLILTLPKRSWVLMGGKLIMNLIEYLIYTIPAAIYLSFLGPTAEFIFGNFKFNMSTVMGEQEITNGSSYWYNVKMLYKTVFGNFDQVLKVALLIAVTFIVIQIFFNIAFAIYATFIKSKKKHSIIMAIIIFFMFFIPTRVASTIFRTITMNNVLPEMSIFTVIMLAFAVIYFVLTSWLIEKKIEV